LKKRVEYAARSPGVSWPSLLLFCDKRPATWTREGRDLFTRALMCRWDAAGDEDPGEARRDVECFRRRAGDGATFREAVVVGGRDWDEWSRSFFFVLRAWPLRWNCFWHEMADMTARAVAIVGVDHVQITVGKSDEVAARQFYCELLGLREIEKPEALKARGGFWLAVGDRQVHVGVEEGVDRAATKAHVAYRVSDVAAWRARLVEAGVKILESVAIPGYERFEFRDPFGNRVEMIAAS